MTSPKTVRLAVATIFFVNGTVLASWVPHIPYVQNKLGLSEGLLGLALLSIAVGALVSLTLSGWLIKRFSSRTVTRVATMIFCLALPLPILAPNFILLIIALAIFGLGNGAMDVAMNAQGVAVEKGYDKPIMSSFHGLFSLGGLTGAGLGGVLLTMDLSPTMHVLGTTIIMGLIGLVALQYLLPPGTDEISDEPAFALPSKRIIGLSVLAFFTLVGEGAVADWSAVYLSNVLGSTAGLAAAGFAAFSLMMAMGRLTGDYLVGYFGPTHLVQVSATIAATGLGVALFIEQPYAAIVGFACVGLGLSNIIPVLFSAAGRTPGVTAGTGIAAVATVGYFGFLVGPPLIGFAAELTSLTVALFVVVAFIALVAVFASTINRATEQPLVVDSGTPSAVGVE